ncbi:MAG: hypothetical protein WKF73_01905 [Nocardioidaceae bacterium]
MALRPDQLGQRVVVRRVLPGQAGPSGGPAMIDVLGILEKWNDESLSVRREDGRVFQIAHADIVTAKPVPPRASVRQRIPAADLQRICSRGWQPTEQASLGAWLLRAAGGFTGRANSVLVAGDPGLPDGAALTTVLRWYAARRLPALAQVTTDSPWLDELSSRGWVTARPDEGDALVQVASVAQARRVRRQARSAQPGTLAVRLDETPDDDWIQLYGRTAEVRPDIVRAVLSSGDRVAFASIKDPLRLVSPWPSAARFSPETGSAWQPSRSNRLFGGEDSVPRLSTRCWSGVPRMAPCRHTCRPCRTTAQRSVCMSPTVSAPTTATATCGHPSRPDPGLGTEVVG